MALYLQISTMNIEQALKRNLKKLREQIITSVPTKITFQYLISPNPEKPMKFCAKVYRCTAVMNKYVQKFLKKYTRVSGICFILGQSKVCKILSIKTGALPEP